MKMLGQYEMQQISEISYDRSARLAFPTDSQTSLENVICIVICYSLSADAEIYQKEREEPVQAVDEKHPYEAIPRIHICWTIGVMKTGKAILNY